MAITRISPPPINVEANDWSFKKWFQDIYQYTKGGILVPSASVQTMYGGTRNYLLNGDFQVWQRGTSSFTVSAVAKTYGPDRWCQGRGSISGSTMSQVSITSASGRLPLDFRYALRSQRTATDTNTADVTLVQAIESANSVQLRGKKVVLSYWVRTGSGFTGGFRARIFTSTGTDENVLSGMTGRLIPLNVLMSSFSASDWTFYSHVVTLDSGLNTVNVGFSYVPSNATAGSNEYYDITGVQLELARDAVSPIPTAYEYIPFDVELARCGRYYQKSFPYATVPAQNTASLTGALTFACMVAGATTNISDSIPFVPRMRTAPTMTYYNPSAANAFVRNVTRSTNATATSGLNVGEAGSAVTSTGVTGWTVGDQLAVHWQADAEI